MKILLLHELIYDVICEICYDREYLYLSYISAFNELTGKIYAKNRLCESGDFSAAGIKSDYSAVFRWGLIRRIEFMPYDEAKLSVSIINKYTGGNILYKKYILSISSGTVAEDTDES